MKFRTLIVGFGAGLILALSSNVVAKSFPDVNASDWFFDYVQKIATWGIISGNDNGTFAPERNVVRAELSKMFVLLDERTDSKITTAKEELTLGYTQAIDQASPAVATTVATALPTTMHLVERRNASPLCPTAWEEVDYGVVGSGTDRFNQRTCLTQNRCEVLYLTKHKNNTPAACPQSWTEANLGATTENDMQRVCFICEA